MEKIAKPRGTMDVMAPDVFAWNHIEKTVRETAERFGFTEIKTPMFEEIGLFKRGVGETTDVVQKEMYSFTDKDGTVYALRPEGTASVARAIIENGKAADTLPLKYFYLINCFRYEKPEAGRSREFVQFGCEMFGAPGAGADFTVISLANSVIRSLGLTNVRLHINSIGCPACRPKYREALVDYLRAHRAELCDTCLDRMETNPLRVLDCKNDSCKKVAENAPRTVDHLCPECEAHLGELKSYLDACGIGYVIDPHIVRGLDYYTRTVFEFIAEGIGSQSTVCGGGRYDGLMEELGGPKMAGIGFGMGITRLILAMKQNGVEIPALAVPELYIAAMGKEAAVRAARIVSDLRESGINADSDIMGRSLKAQMKYADKIAARYTLILGDAEIASGRAVIKEMATSEQTEVPLDGIAAFLAGKRG
ncbi:MAG: histidine--tRNA ligase [Clostridia bacterium]|nr:histidine--tRNA ligase [Clostridia bacterium]MBQ3956212.1 histidine--tRNA ligase [Clostridia bacterium]